MKLTAKSEYACLALMDLAQHHRSGLRTIGQISQDRNIPKKYLEQILLSLKRAGYVQSRKGFEGGYELARSPGSFSVAEIIRLFDGPLAPVGSVSEHYYRPTPIEQDRNLVNLFAEVRKLVADKLERTTFAELCGRRGK